MAKNKHRDPVVSLDLAEQFYIEQHGHLSVEEISRNLGKSVELVQAYANEWLAKNPPTPRVRKLMQKEKGTLGMTAEASMAADDSKFKKVTLAGINRAIADGRMEDAADLRRRYDEQNRGKVKDRLREKYSERIHYIIPPDDPGGDIY